ncbi:MAG: DUF4242 domain-containing protein [Bacteroidetes bacterium]|nr:DUF4242 domain-containing protein [Bacteroidota bacterium]
MPLFMDRHDVPGVTAWDVARAHQEDLNIQHRFNCRAITYWFDEERGTAFCLIEAPSANEVRRMHDAAHGLVPHQIIEVRSNVVESFLGRITDPQSAAGESASHALIDESAYRAVVCIDFRGACNFGGSGGMTTSDSIMRRSDVVRTTVQHFGGSMVECSEREALASFFVPSQAVRCANALLQKGKAQGADATERKDAQGAGFCPRIGISAGEPLYTDTALFSETVRCARRLCEVAPDRQALLSPSLKPLASGDGQGMNLREGIVWLAPDEHAFVHRMMDVLDAVWKEPDLRVSDYCRELGMSRSQAYRKISTLTGSSPAGFIRNYRLRRAVALLEERFGTVSETAFEAGFGSLSYFSKCFKKKYGMLPSEYAGSAS